MRPGSRRRRSRVDADRIRATSVDLLVRCSAVVPTLPDVERLHRRSRRTLRRGFSDEIGSWKIICMRVRASRSVVAAHGSVSSWPSNITDPLVRLGQLHDRPPVVLLPQPDSPTRPSVSPGSTSRLNVR